MLSSTINDSEISLNNEQELMEICDQQTEKSPLWKADIGESGEESESTAASFYGLEIDDDSTDTESVSDPAEEEEIEEEWKQDCVSGSARFVLTFLSDLAKQNKLCTIPALDESCDEESALSPPGLGDDDEECTLPPPPGVEDDEESALPPPPGLDRPPFGVCSGCTANLPH